MPQLENFRLKVFRTVAGQLSFRKAAELLFLTQPAVTLQIKALEEDLGVRLFNRAAGRVSLTRQGSVLLGYALKIAAMVSEAEQQLATGENQLSGKLALGVSTTIAQYVLPRRLAGFLAENPRIELSIRSGNTDQVVQLLMREKVHIGLIEGPARERDVRTEPLMKDELVLVTPANFEYGRLSHEQLTGFPLLVRERGSGSRRVVEAALRKVGIGLKRFKSVLELDSTEAIKSAVEAGLGIGFVSRWAISREFELGTLSVAETTSVKVVRHFMLAFRAGPDPQGPAGAFRSFALAAAAAPQSRGPDRMPIRLANQR